MKRKIIMCAGMLLSGMRVYAQPACPTSGTVSATCRTVGNLTVSGTLNINPGVTFEVTGRITYTGRTINATGAIVEAGSMREQWAGSYLNGGTYDVTGDFTTSGDFESNGATINVGGDLTFGGSGANHDYINSVYNIVGDLSFGSGTHSIDGTSFDVGTGYAGTTGIDVLSLNGGTVLDVLNGSTMDIRGDVNAGNSATVNIDASHMYVTGNFDNAGSGVVTISNGGTLIVDGDYDNAGSGSTTVDGGGMVVGGDYEGDDPVVTGGGAEGCGGGSGGCCGSACSGMPVTLVSFSAGVEQDFVQLSWQTSSELNNDRFNIYRSENGKNFELIDWVKGNGTTNEVKTYNWKDYPSKKGVYYYQLEQIDYDGTNELFSIKQVNFYLSASEPKVYPMPIAEGDDFYISLSDKTIKSVSIFDLSARTSVSLDYVDEPGRIRVGLSNLGLQRGVYIVQVTTMNGQFNQKLKID